ncbi:hypothetical protein [Larsenimonas rhizosphaerae]|uniref:hypothetical protein n=1 Tax=Larsenimonas rhizosphaerae TaxID=2944682 RepID=UPI0020333A4D|nr:hypothetical protein [Larsenimonas rhizosphaerae]MCM2130783.1 hypothetical protein [Larsenimonas rhizosphaerae]
MTSSTATAHGQSQTRICADGARASNEPAAQMFYMTGKNTILLVPQEAMCSFSNELRTLEALVDAQQEAMANLKYWQNRYIAYIHGSYFKPGERPDIDRAGGVGNQGSVAIQVQLARRALNQANAQFNDVIDSLTAPDDESNNIVELVALQRRGASESSAGFRMGYVRASKISPDWERYPLASASDDEVLNEHGRVDWATLDAQLKALPGKMEGRNDWVDGWLALEDQEKELFHWSEAINRNLELNAETQSGGDHESGAIKVALNNEAQLMRWTHGASGISINASPFEGKGTIKASGHASLMLAQAKSEIHCYEPPGGYMMQFQLPSREDDDSSAMQLIDLGMLRSHVILASEGRVGASLAAELNIEADLSSPNGRTAGIRGTLDPNGLPGMQRVDMSTSDDEDDADGNQIRAFAGAELECTVTGQIEWKNPEVDEFRPFGKLAPQLTAQAGGGFEGGLQIGYRQGKFTFMAKAGFCWGVGAKGKVSGEVDKDLVLEFIKWTAYQLRHVNFQRLDFIGAEAFQAISNLVYLVIITGEQVENFLDETAAAISITAQEKYEEIKASIERGIERGELTSRINADPDVLKYASPEAKGALLYLLTTSTIVDEMDWRNAASPFDRDAWRFGALPNRKRAIIRVFEWVQSKAEFDCVMERVAPAITVTELSSGDKKVRKKEGEEKIYGFLGMGERERIESLPEFSKLYTSDYGNDLRRIYEDLPEVAPKGDRMVSNRVEEYFTQIEQKVTPNFYTPCNNSTDIIFLPNKMMVS